MSFALHVNLQGGEAETHEVGLGTPPITCGWWAMCCDEGVGHARGASEPSVGGPPLSGEAEASLTRSLAFCEAGSLPTRRFPAFILLRTMTYPDRSAIGVTTSDPDELDLRHDESS